MLFQVEDFKPLVIFLIKNYEDLFSSPINGNIDKISHIFNYYCKSKEVKKAETIPHFSRENFICYIEQLNEICGALNISGDMKDERPFRAAKITWVNLPTLLLLHDRLNGLTAKEIKFQSSKMITEEDLKKKPDRLLLDFLEKPLFSEIKVDFTNGAVIDNGFNVSFSLLNDILKKPSSRDHLAKQKAALKVSRKRFSEICNDTSHNSTLSSICFNKKDYCQQGTRNAFPSDQTIQQKLNLLQHLMSREIFKCSQTKVHYLPVLNNNTDMNLGDCSYLDTCHKMKACRYLHYYTLKPPHLQDKVSKEEQASNYEYTIGECFTEYCREQIPAQWINCDVRYLPFLILGKFAVIISDPAWDIHMSLPYGTCKDFELLSLPMHELQDEGIILLWVTGRSIEIGRKALLKWGYKCSDEMIWVKLNQLKRTIVTGRTGHWLNHSKEHLLVGIKGNPYWLNRKIDTDVIVSGTRETSRKPDEVYDIVERIVGKHSRKLEIFGRDHNIRPGWLTIGNQLQGTYIYEQDVKSKYDHYKSQSSNHKV
ncbi:uncharacterized protein PRCAT00001370001 [Priceomyces carsonii]|uniref:uncharacterized protein n=1 Tax=Priceomyces carsonii TaxID=28549 RepID=UPI002ED9E33B|nr:unnamed protein product [Priceomyces carsonii]